MTHLIVAGYTALDEFTIKPGTTPIVRYGGSAANVAVMAAAMELQVELLSVIGSSIESEEYLQYLAQQGVATDLMLRTDGGMDRCRIFISTGQKQWIPRTARAFSSLQLPIDRLRKSLWIHIAQAPQSIVEQIRVVQLDAGLSFSPGPSLLAGTMPARYCVEVAWRFLFLNQTEARFVERWYGKRLEHLILDEGIPWIFVTRGAAAVLALGQKEAFEIPSLSGPVVDTTGAGDAFAAGVISFYLQGFNVNACVRLGVALASIVIEGVGSQWRIPTREEVFRRAGIVC